MVKKYMQYGVLAFVLTLQCATPGLADISDILLAEDYGHLEASAGYRWVGTDNNPNRAAEYSYLKDSPTFTFGFSQLASAHKFSLTGNYLNYNDYSFEGGFDKTLYRLHVRSERMYHNLDHIPETREDSLTFPTHAEFEDLNPDDDYGRRISIDEIKVRGKLPDYPAHINLSYWRMEKKGDAQLRFVDEHCASACHMQSRTRQIDRVTEEVTAGIDAHLGPVDIAFLQTLREFRDKAADPNDPFNSHVLGREANSYSHDTAPDSRLLESSFTINLPPSGGFVTAASYTIGKRENESSLVGVSPTDPETDYQKLAADVTYTPGEHWTVNFRYRMLALDSDGPLIQNADNVPVRFGGNLPVRQSIDIDRNNYAASINYRPSRRLTFKGEFEREDIDRNHTGIADFNSFAGVADPYWVVPSNETIDRFRLSFYSRHLDKSAFKLNGWYQHKNVDNPAYGTTLSASDEFFLSASYKPSATWGATGSIDILSGKNDDRTAIQFNSLGDQVPYDLDREEDSEKLALGLWFTPGSIFSADLSYGLLHSNIDQDILFGSTPFSYSILDDNADFEQRVHTFSTGVNLRFHETVNCRLEGYHIRSSSEFTPRFDAVLPYAPDGPAGIKEISEVDIRQNGIKTRVRWQFTKRLTASFEYTFDDYDDRNANAFDGTAQSFIASLGGNF